MQKFEVKPSSLVGAWLQMRNNNYTLVTALCEFIDNIINKGAKSKTTIQIEYYLSRKYPKKNFIRIKDNAEGITSDLLHKVFQIGRGTYKNAIKLFSEHGYGMKAAMLSLGEIMGFKTKYKDDELGSNLVKNNIKERYCDDEPRLDFQSFEDKSWEGTEIVLNNVNTGLSPHSARDMKILGVKLGAIYSKYIDDKTLEIKLKLHNLDTGEDSYDEIVESHHRIWCHGTKRDKNGAPKREPDLPGITLKGGKGKNAWEAIFVAGYKPLDEELHAMTGETKWIEGSPYSPIGKNIGFDVIKHGRTILFGVMGDEYSGRGNYLQGEIHIIKGFTTTTTKDSLRNDKAWKELQKKIKTVVKDYRLDDRVKSGMKRTRGTELQITNRIAEELRKQTFAHDGWGVQDANQEIRAFVEVYTDDDKPMGEVDIMIAPTATDNPGEQVWEVKKEEADTDAVRQLYGYLKARDIKSGTIAAQKLTSKAKNLMEQLNKDKNVDMKYWDYTTLAIFN